MGAIFLCFRSGGAGGCGGVKTPPYGAKDTWAVMAKLRAGHARPLQTAPNGVPTRGAREGGSPPSFLLTGCRGRLRAAYMPPLQSCRSRAKIPQSGTLSYKPYPKTP